MTNANEVLLPPATCGTCGPKTGITLGSWVPVSGVTLTRPPVTMSTFTALDSTASLSLCAFILSLSSFYLSPSAQEVNHKPFSMTHSTSFADPEDSPAARVPGCFCLVSLQVADPADISQGFVGCRSHFNRAYELILVRDAFSDYRQGPLIPPQSFICKQYYATNSGISFSV
ncbi:unnamed protein product [Echinostoma caproni]|uniref:Uncharacterized protein n=1 Tax=Echinostoma caproni TaxID=27848 RepID=A0A183BAH0_9TREM|nr:unnamed protein product [Echinostoma caproni]